MFSQLILKNKPRVTYPPPSVYPVAQTNWTRPSTNRSFLTNDGALQDFLMNTPQEGTWCYRKNNPQYKLHTDLTDTAQCQYVVRVLVSLSSIDMRYSYGEGFPETHELITSCPYATGDHFRRFVDIRDFTPLTDDQYKRFISAELQNYIQTVITPRAPAA